MCNHNRWTNCRRILNALSFARYISREFGSDGLGTRLNSECRLTGVVCHRGMSYDICIMHVNTYWNNSAVCTCICYCYSFCFTFTMGTNQSTRDTSFVASMGGSTQTQCFRIYDLPTTLLTETIIKPYPSCNNALFEN